jgi:hypothetical protein
MRGFGAGLMAGAVLSAAVLAGLALRSGKGRFVAVRVRRGPPQLKLRRGAVEVGIPRLRP